MSFFSEKLPSDGEKKVRCRDYTIGDASKISAMNPRLKEAFASRFLEVIQTGEDRIAPRREMTLRDRETILFKYALVSLQPDKLGAPTTYDVPSCPLCGQKHSFSLSLAQLPPKLSNIFQNFENHQLLYRDIEIKTCFKKLASKSLNRFLEPLNAILAQSTFLF